MSDQPDATAHVSIPDPSDQPEPPERVEATDPRWRSALGALKDPVFVIHPDGNVQIRDTAELELGTDHGKWLSFIDGAVGGQAETVIKQGQSSYYMDSEVYARGSVADFNPTATALSASELGIELRHAKPMFGTVVVTSFEKRHFHPRPFRGDQMLAAFDDLVANEKFATTVTEQLPDSGDPQA